MVREWGIRLDKEEYLGFKTGQQVLRVRSVCECVKGEHYGIRHSGMFPYQRAVVSDVEGLRESVYNVKQISVFN